MSKFSADRWKKVQSSAKVYQLDEVIHFGKYRECTLRQIIEEDPNYVVYLMEECNKQLSDDAYEYLQSFL